jgi:uncharacterized UBP type Zn finger protein
MQLFLHSEDFRNAVEQIDSVEDGLLRSVSWLFKEEYSRHAFSPINPRPLFAEFNKLNPELFAFGQQQDAGEALLSVYDLILEAVSALLPESLSKFELFEFDIVRDVFCTAHPFKVASSNSALERQIVLPLPQGDYADLSFQLNAYFSSEEHASLTSCSDREGTISSRMGSSPKLLVLVVHRNEYGKPKNHIAIKFPRILDTLPGQSSAMYRLIGIVHHHGTRTHAGHYTAEFRHPVSGKWYDADDAKIRRIRAPTQYSRTAYLFMYERMV